MAKGNLDKNHIDQTLAQDIMSTVLVVLHPKQKLRAAVELLTQNKLTVLPVVDDKGKLLGLLTEKDVLSSACESPFGLLSDFLERPIRYRKKVRTIALETPMNEIVTILANKPSRHIPVVDKNYILKGIITRRDLIRIVYLRLELNDTKELNFEV